MHNIIPIPDNRFTIMPPQGTIVRIILNPGPTETSHYMMAVGPTTGFIDLSNGDLYGPAILESPTAAAYLIPNGSRFTLTVGNPTMTG